MIAIRTVLKKIFLCVGILVFNLQLRITFLVLLPVRIIRKVLSKKENKSFHVIRRYVPRKTNLGTFTLDESKMFPLDKQKSKIQKDLQWRFLTERGPKKIFCPKGTFQRTWAPSLAEEMLRKLWKEISTFELPAQMFPSFVEKRS